MSEAMKAGDLQRCALCGHGMMHTGLPLFYRVRIEQMAVDLNAVRRAGAMEQYMGGHVAIARVFEDPDIAAPMFPASTKLVCQSCALEPHMLARLTEETGEACDDRR